MNDKLKELIASLSDEDRAALRQELQQKAVSTVALEDITPQRVLSDPAFADQVRRDIVALLTGEMQ